MAKGGTIVKPAVSVLIRIRGVMPNLRPAEQRVAHAVLADPAKVSESSITLVARMCETSETTVLRFCRAIGLAGYPELRLALARAAHAEENNRRAGEPATGEITARDSLAEVVAKVTYADARAAEDTGALLDIDALCSAIDAIARAPRVGIYGIGSSALAGQQLQQRLHHLGLLSFMWSDPHLALSASAILGPRDAAIGISHTGATGETVEALRFARSRGATTVAVTNFERSPITEVADVVLRTASRETTFRAGAMSSRSAQFTVVDCLFSGLAQRSFDSSLRAMDRSESALRQRRQETAG